MSSNVNAAMAFVAEKVAPLTSESFSNQSSQVKNYPQISEEELTVGNKKIIQTYGIPLLNSEGSDRNDFWRVIWKRGIKLRVKQYRIPGGAVGRQLTLMYADELKALAKGGRKF